MSIFDNNDASEKASSPISKAMNKRTGAERCRYSIPKNENENHSPTRKKPSIIRSFKDSDTGSEY